MATVLGMVEGVTRRIGTGPFPPRSPGRELQRQVLAGVLGDRPKGRRPAQRETAQPAIRAAAGTGWRRRTIGRIGPWRGRPLEPAGVELERLRSTLRDDRSGRVVFVAHCLLNENVRYLGGAGRPGVVREIVEGLQRQDVGICQMPCPEQAVWGGVLKRHLLAMYGSGRRTSRPVRRLIAALLLSYTRWRYRRQARALAGQIADYGSSGMEIAGVIGVDASPSCGVHQTLDLDAALEVLATCDPATIDRATFNRDVVAATRVAGEGLFIKALRLELARRGQPVRFLAHDLVAEIDGRPIAPIDVRS